MPFWQLGYLHGQETIECEALQCAKRFNEIPSPWLSNYWVAAQELKPNCNAKEIYDLQQIHVMVSKLKFPNSHADQSFNEKGDYTLNPKPSIVVSIFLSVIRILPQHKPNIFNEIA